MTVSELINPATEEVLRTVEQTDEVVSEDEGDAPAEGATPEEPRAKGGKGEKAGARR